MHKVFQQFWSLFSSNPAHPPAGRNPVGPPSFQDGASPPVKSCLCNKYNSAEGCKFGDKCNFAHGEWELGRPTLPSYDNPRAMGPLPGRYCGSRIEPSPPGLGAAASFGASAPAKISVDASLGGAIIGKSCVNSKQICLILIIFILIGCLIFPHLLKNEFQYNVRGNLEH